MRAAIILGATLAALAAAPPPPRADEASAATPDPSATAGMSENVRLSATLTPERLGQGTTIGFGFRVSTPSGRLPPPLVAINVSYPQNIGIGLSGLGVASCSQGTLETSGAGACPPNSVMGYGRSLAEIRIGPELVRETTPITILRGPDQEGHISLLLYATGPRPVDAQLVAPGLLLPASAPFGGSVTISVPLVPSIPGAPDIAIVALSSTLGPQGVTYFEQAAGNTLAYQPRGFLLPSSCPRGGFPFSAELTFQDGSHASARTAVPCPGHRRGHRRRH